MLAFAHEPADCGSRVKPDYAGIEPGRPAEDCTLPAENMSARVRPVGCQLRGEVSGADVFAESGGDVLFDCSGEFHDVTGGFLKTAMAI